ncbi:MAG: DEAD/DEAH box helicase, partial [Acidimicrobiales bacterium]
IADGVASLFLERGGRGLLALRDTDGSWEQASVAALTTLVTAGRLSRLTIAAPAPALEPHLRAAGFVPTPRGLALYPALSRK